jgi:hypothetical protein
VPLPRGEGRTGRDRARGPTSPRGRSGLVGPNRSGGTTHGTREPATGSGTGVQTRCKSRGRTSSAEPTWWPRGPARLRSGGRLGATVMCGPVASASLGLPVGRRSGASSSRAWLIPPPIGSEGEGQSPSGWVGSRGPHPDLRFGWGGSDPLRHGAPLAAHGAPRRPPPTWCAKTCHNVFKFLPPRRAARNVRVLSPTPASPPRSARPVARGGGACSPRRLHRGSARTPARRGTRSPRPPRTRRGRR